MYSDLLPDILQKSYDLERKVQENSRLLFESSPNPIIAISAESKSALRKYKMLSFGNGGQSHNTGYVIARRGRLLGRGLASVRDAGGGQYCHSY